MPIDQEKARLRRERDHKKRSDQLGMNRNTALVKLNRDIIFNFVQKTGEVCYRCSKPMTRDTFSVEHKEPWLDSDEPSKLFFDLDNIAFSHMSCNSSHTRVVNKIKDWEPGEYQKSYRVKIRQKNLEEARK